MKRLPFFLGLGLTILLTSGLAWLSGQMPTPGATPQVVVIQQMSYLQETRESMIDKADAIFLGRVIEISPSRWNQDSGAYWQNEEGVSGLQFHTVEVEVVQPVVDTLGLDQYVTIVILGSSPVDRLADGPPVHVEHELENGDLAMLFIRSNILDWRDGTQPTLQLIGDPSDSYFSQGEGGRYFGRANEQPMTLDELIVMIERRRPIIDRSN